jgi:hypothetical protein
MSITSTTKKALTATAIAAALVGTGVAAAVGGFDDVADDNPHAEGIQWLVDNGITVGCDADSFCPSDNLSRAQMGSFMFRLSGNDPDVDPSVNATLLDGVDSTAFVQGVETVSTSLALENDTFENVVVTCPAGKVAIAGGYQLRLSEDGAISSVWYAAADQPTTDGDGWVASVRTLDGAAHDGFATVFATCISS